MFSHDCFRTVTVLRHEYIGLVDDFAIKYVDEMMKNVLFVDLIQ
jgi:hypothetical protein